MGARVDVRVMAGAIDVAAELAVFPGDETNAGALATFIGYCRDESGTLDALELEHYPGMAERQIAAIAHEATDRFGLMALTVVHRHGRMQPGDVIVLVAALSRHRDAAFDGARMVMDYLKTDAPFWKKEHRKDGSTDWVAASDTDDSARKRWQG